jgi:prevent-host-death family protein
MRRYNLAEAKARFSELVARAAAGEEVEITRHGKPAARLSPAQRCAKPIDLAALQAVTEAMPWQDEGAEAFIRRLRDDARY